MNAANDTLRVNGVGRDASDPRTLVIYFNERPSDDDMRRIHNLLRDGQAQAAPADLTEFIATLGDAARYLLQNGQTKQGLAVRATITMLEDDSDD